MAGDLIRFVDSIVASPTVRLDLNDEVSWWVKSFSAPPPRLRRSVAENAMRDGINVGSASYSGRTLTIELECRKSTQDLAATEIQKLWRELDRETNWIMYQPTGATKPVFFKTFRSDTSQLADVMAQTAMRTFTIEVLAEPFALGLKEAIGPFTISNNPASGTNPCYFDVTGVIGDVPTPVVLWDDATGDGGRYLACTHAATAVPFSWSQAESMTLGTDTTNPGGGPDAAMSGTGANNFRRTSFATASMQVRLTWAVPATAVGRFRVVVLLRGTAATTGLFTVAVTNRDTVGVWSDGLATPVTFDNLTAPVATRRLLDLGLVDLSPVPTLRTGYGATANALTTTNLYIYASRTSGTGTVEWDAVILVPAGGQADETISPSLLLTPDAPTNPVIDGIAETIVGRSVAGDPTTGTATFNRAATLPAAAGAFPRLCPVVTNRIFFLRVSASGDSPVATSTVLSGAYWPRYLFVRPSAT